MYFSRCRCWQGLKHDKVLKRLSLSLPASADSVRQSRKERVNVTLPHREPTTSDKNLYSLSSGLESLQQGHRLATKVERQGHWTHGYITCHWSAANLPQPVPASAQCVPSLSADWNATIFGIKDQALDIIDITKHSTHKIVWETRHVLMNEQPGQKVFHASDPGMGFNCILLFPTMSDELCFAFEKQLHRT